MGEHQTPKGCSTCRRQWMSTQVGCQLGTTWSSPGVWVHCPLMGCVSTLRQSVDGAEIKTLSPDDAAGETNRKERGEKLTSTQIEQTLGQFEAEPIPEDHPMVPQLNEMFGEHTYFVNSDRLIILEPAGSGLAGVVSAKVVNLGEWSDDAPSALELHEPETTDLVVTLGFRH